MLFLTVLDMVLKLLHKNNICHINNNNKFRLNNYKNDRLHLEDMVPEWWQLQLMVAVEMLAAILPDLHRRQSRQHLHKQFDILQVCLLFIFVWFYIDKGHEFAKPHFEFRPYLDILTYKF